MAGNSHKHTRLVSYTKKRRRASAGIGLWIIIPISALLAFILAIILGNTLGSMVDPPKESESSSSPSESLTPEAMGPAEIVGYHVTLEGVYDNTAASVRGQIPSGASAVSLTLFSPSAYPYYISTVAESFGNPCGELTLHNAFLPITEKELYSSVIFPSALLSSDPIKSGVIGAYEAALASELYEAGANEIVICFRGIGGSETVIGDGTLELITDYVAALKKETEGLRIGVMLSPGDVLSPQNKLAVQKLSEIADFCALDLTAYTDGEALASDLLTAVTDVMRLKMRLVMSKSDKSEDFLAAADELISKLGIKNIQYVG